MKIIGPSAAESKVSSSGYFRDAKLGGKSASKKCTSAACSTPLLVRRFASQFRQLSLLLRCQLIFDAYEQGYLFPFDFAFRRQHLFQLRKSLLLVHPRLLGQPHQLLHFILQLPLQFSEFQLRLADFRLEIFFLLGAQPNRFLMLNHQLRGKETLPDGILIGLLRAGCSPYEQKCRANAENFRSHFIPPHPSSRELSDTIHRISASTSKSPAPESSASRQWAPAILPVSAPRQVRSQESFALLSVAGSRQSSEPPQPWRPLRPVSTLATASRASLHSRPSPQLAPGLGNPPGAPLLAPRAAATRPAVTCAPTHHPAQRNNSRSFSDALRDPLLQWPSVPRPATCLSIFRTHSSFHHFQQEFSRRVYPRPYRTCRNPQHRAYAGGVHLFHERELQDASEFLRQAFYFSPQPVQEHLPFRVLRAVNHRPCFCDLPGGIARQPPPVAPPAVQGQPEHDPVYPRAEFLRFPERGELLVGAQKRFLGDIFRVGGIAQDAVGDLKNAPLILSDALAKSRLGIMHFGSANQRTHARACHASF